MSGGFNPNEYNTVAERIEAFIAKYPDGCLQSEVIELSDNRVVMRGLAYRSADDPRPGIGTSAMPIPATNSMLRNSEIETAETSAWGRAIAALGFEVKKGVASRDEVDNKKVDEPERQVGKETLELLGRIQKSGVAMAGGAAAFKGEWRETPEGHVVGFKLKLTGEDRDIPQVLVTGAIGEALFVGSPAILGEQITVKGHLYNVKQQGRTAYYRLIVGERPEDFIETSEVRIPLLPDPEQAAVDAASTDPERAHEPIAEGQEALPI